MKNPRMDAYAAGLVDGEGCITAKSTKSGTAMGIRVLVGMATKANELLGKMRLEYGGTLITQSPTNPKHSDIATWTVTGAEAATFLRRIEPHLILKVEQARLALRIEEIRTSQQRIGNRDHYRWTQDSMDRCQVLYRRLMELNGRGSLSETSTPPPGGVEIARLVAGQWVTSQADMFSDLGWEPFSGTWPRWGCMSDGRAFELPTSAPRITANASSSLSRLPTPKARDHKGTNSPGGHGRRSPDLSEIGAYLPTPVTTDAKGARNATATRQPGSQHHGGTTLTDAVTVLPTPVAQPSGNSPEAHLRKKPGRTQVTDLSIIVENGLLGSGGKVLPSPKASDATGGGQHPDKRKGHTQQLVDAVLGLTGAPTLPLFDDGSD